MSGPTGLIFAMRSRYKDQSGTEAFFNEVDTGFSGQSSRTVTWTAGISIGAAAGLGTTGQVWHQPSVLNPVGSGGSTLTTMLVKVWQLVTLKPG